MQRISRLLLLFLGLFYCINLWADSSPLLYNISLLLGTDLLSGTQPAQDVALSPVLTNQYGAATENSGLHLWGLNLGYQVNEIGGLSKFNARFGVTILNHFATYNGTEIPAINYGGGDPLNYSFDESNLAFLAETTLMYNIYSWRPYIIVGVGPSYNQLSNYQESPVNPGGSATPLPPYRSHTTMALAYQLGLGVEKDIDKRFGVAADLRYISFGKNYLQAPAGAYYDPSANLNAPHSTFLGLTLSGIYRF